MRINSRRGRAALATIVAAGACASVALVSGPANASVTSIFEIDGNVLDDSATTPPDWGATSGTNSIFTTASVTGGTVIGTPRATLPPNFFDAGFVRDFVPGSTSDTTTYTQGSKDTLDIPGWSCKTSNNVTDKGDIQNAYAAVATDPSNQHLILYFGMEKNSSNGDNNMGVWFLQDASIGCSGSGTFSGNHKDGDVFLVAAFTNGGGCSLVNAYSWKTATNGLSAPVVATPTCGGTSTLTATTNSGQVTTPWTTVDKVLGQGTTLGADQFYEGAVDLTANNLDRDSSGNPVCTNKFIFDTRSSQVTGSTLYDFAEGNVHTCFPTSVSTLLKKDVAPAGPDANDVSLPATPASAHTVTLPVSVYDTSSLTANAADPTGTITYSLWTNSSCTTAATTPLFANNTNIAAPVAVGSASPSLLFTMPGDYWWKAVYTPSSSSRNTGSESVCSTEPLSVVKPQPTIATSPSVTSIVIGGSPAASFNDVATVSNGYFPTPNGGILPGTVTFKLYGPFSSAPGASSCIDSGTGANLIASAGGDVAATMATDTSATATSASYTPTSVGIYQWVAKYNGNAQNLATAFSACGDTSEQVTVQPAQPTATTAQTWRPQDSMTVTGISGAGDVKGNVTFKAFDTLAKCTADAAGTSSYSQTVDRTANTGQTLTASTTNSSFDVSTTKSIWWKASFVSTNSNLLNVTSNCTETSTVTIDNGSQANTP